MTFGITQVERLVWQCRAVAELAAILRMHADLPLLAWTVWSAGSVLLGRVGAAASAPDARAVFNTWKTVLILEEVPCGVERTPSRSSAPSRPHPTGSPSGALADTWCRWDR